MKSKAILLAVAVILIPLHFSLPEAGAICTEEIPGDVDGNCKVDVNDFALLANDWFTTEELEPSDSNVIQEWVARHDGPVSNDDTPYAIAIDSFNNIYVTGVSRKEEGGDGDCVTIKYDPNGNEIWVATYNGPGNSIDVATAIAIDSNNNIYVTGHSKDSGTGYDYVTIKYAPDSNVPLWVARYNSPSNNYDFAKAIAIDSDDNVYVTGISPGTDTGEDYATVKYSPELVCTTEITGDVDNNCTVDFADLAEMTSHWLECNLDPQTACWE